MDDTTPTKTFATKLAEIKNVYTQFYSMINEYNNIDAQAKKEYLALITGWLVREKDALAYKENSGK